MIRIEFTEESVDKLRYERFYHLHPWGQRTMEALLLKSDGLPHHQITRILGIGPTDVVSVFFPFGGAAFSFSMSSCWPDFRTHCWLA